MTVMLLGAQPASVSCCIWRAGAEPGSSSQAICLLPRLSATLPCICALLKVDSAAAPRGKGLYVNDRLVPASLSNLLSICCRAKHSSCLTACSTRRQEPRTAQPLPDQPHAASHPHSPALPVPP